MYSQASNLVKGVDDAFVVILAICLFFFVGIAFFMIYFVIRYNKKRNPKPEDVKDNNLLEIIWTVVPTIIVLIMFYFGYLGYKPMRQVPAGAIEIKAIGRMWNWSFEYQNGKISNDVLVVPVNKAVKLNLYSPDVVHSLYIPAYRIKEDVVPGKDNFMWFIPEKLGEFDILCAEYCGVNHAYMLGSIKVVPEEEYNSWYVQVEQVDSKKEAVGLQVIKKNACVGCHSLDGSKIIGPSFKGLFGSKRSVKRDGKTISVIADDEYLKHSIYDPNADVVEGYNKGMMISYKELISEEELKEVISYIKSLNE